MEHKFVEGGEKIVEKGKKASQWVGTQLEQIVRDAYRPSCAARDANPNLLTQNGGQWEKCSPKERSAEGTRGVETTVGTVWAMHAAERIYKKFFFDEATKTFTRWVGRGRSSVFNTS